MSAMQPTIPIPLSDPRDHGGPPTLTAYSSQYVNKHVQNHFQQVLFMMIYAENLSNKLFYCYKNDKQISRKITRNNAKPEILVRYNLTCLEDFHSDIELLY